MQFHRRSLSGGILTLNIETDQEQLKLHKNKIYSTLELIHITFFYSYLK
ncbi:MAG: hypothetical protein AAGE84_07080 [Cyanobacteria bacterium P01_G01_bin.39]